MPTTASLAHTQQTGIHSSSSSLHSSGSINPAYNANMPQAHLKQLAIQNAPSAAKADLLQTLDVLEQSMHLDHAEAIELAKSFVNTYKTEPEVMDCLFKYLTCRFMLDHQNVQAKALSQRDSIGLLRQSMDNLRGSPNSISNNRSKLLNQASRLGPVVTSHPTQLSRPESSEHLLTYPAKGFDSEFEAQSFAEGLWSRAGRRTEKPSVLDEAKAAAPAVKNIMASMRKNAKVLMQETDDAQSSGRTPWLEAGNWIAGDRDGNPTITPELLGEVMTLWSTLAFDQYLHKVSDTNAEQRPNCLHNLFVRAGHQEQLQALKTKLEATRRHVVDNASAFVTEGRFENPAEITHYVDSLKSDLDWQALSTEEKNLLNQKLDQLGLWANTFGFHGVSTHIRQNSEVNLRTVDALVEATKPGTSYASLQESDKVALLTKILNNDPEFKMPQRVVASSPEVQQEIKFLDSYKGLRTRFGNDALPTIITANTETLSDMLEVCVMLKYAGLGKEAGLGMNVVPLIETVPDMKNAKALVQDLLNTPAYSAHLETAGKLQRVMLGYSDSMRGNGIVSAAWEGHKLPSELLHVAKAAGVKLHFFHGRGGTEARGARNGYTEEISHVDGDSLEAGYTQTEQGEEVFKKFGNRALSDNNISEMISSALQTSAQGSDKKIAEHERTMTSISGHADIAYQALYQDPQLAEFLQQTTPLPYVGLSNAGSRPASRIANLQGPAFLAKLRAIPYVAAWYQSGSMAPAYFGLGSGLRQHIDSVPGQATTKIAELKKMYQEWPFFKNLIDRAESAIQKADMRIAEQYASLSPDTRSLFEKVESEFKLSREMIDLVKGQNSEMDPTQSNPLRTFAHAAQIELLRSAKSAELASKPAVETGVAMSMQTLASALTRFG
ncbi:MAG TPA: phosphoenolpyruvate carboxylase [Limnobacter sp.]|nr:phosphoenolpyruvate carboxylase [Limnobacter sp.]